jgi:hypothetical protein
MNDHKEHISHYSAADIQRYVQGKLSAGEMHAMEKAALDDPFLADAIEGMQQALAHHDETLVTSQLRQLQQQFKTRTTGTGKVVAFKPFRYWQAAAAAVVVIITGVWVYSLLTNTNSPEKTQAVIAKTDELKQQQAQAPAFKDSRETAISTDSTTVLPGNTATVLDNTPNATTSSTVISNKNKKEVTTTTAPAAAPPIQETSSLSHQKTDSVKQYIDNRLGNIAANKDVTARKKEAASTPPAAAVPESLMKARKSEDPKPQERERETELITIAKSDSHFKKSSGNNNFNNNLSGVIKGQVTDLNNNPVANAYVQINKNNNNIITDKTGFFKIPVTDSVVDVAVNVTGYGTQNFRLQNNAAMNQLQLQPANAALNKPVVPDVKGKKVALNRSNYPSAMVHDAEPVDGWAAFDQYLEKNKKTMSGVVNAGHVVVSFQVNKKGTLSDFKIEQSLSKTYDDEAIRLITQGPAWKLLKGRKARITVMVRF